MSRSIILIILDGYGKGNKGIEDAVNTANTPNLDKIFNNNPLTFISASGNDVGLPDGQMGNSEVGHTNIGAGRIVYQELTRISRQIKNKTFFDNLELKNIMEYVKSSGAVLHIGGLMSDGGVHSHISHLYAILEMVKQYNIKNVCIHVWLDGRDTSPHSGINYIKECEKKLLELGVGKIETISGRYYSMDRDSRWERVTKAYDAIVNANGIKFSSSEKLIESSYKNNITDEFIEPSVRDGYNGMHSEDAFICFNFRPDRVREITRAFTERKNNEIFCKRVYPKKYLCFTKYDENLDGVSIAFKNEKIVNTFGEYISDKGLRQLRIAETEKYAHVTFFFNGGNEKPLEYEDRILIPSPKVSTYDLKPEMSAYEVSDKSINALRSLKYDVIILNYANCDMVGHTGIFDATVRAVETVDACIGQLIKVVNETGYVALITADHGNAEKMLSRDGSPFTAHTLNLVPFCVVNYKCNLAKNGTLADIAPTMLHIMDLKKPYEMTGNSLII